MNISHRLFVVLFIDMFFYSCGSINLFPLEMYNERQPLEKEYKLGFKDFVYNPIIDDKSIYIREVSSNSGEVLKTFIRFSRDGTGYIDSTFDDFTRFDYPINGEYFKYFLYDDNRIVIELYHNAYEKMVYWYGYVQNDYISLEKEKKRHFLSISQSISADKSFYYKKEIADMPPLVFPK